MSESLVLYHGYLTVISEALEFERSNWSDGSVADDAFYTVPADSTQVPAGTLLKVEKDVETSKYLLPPATALSRIMYQSENLSGALVPVSALVLWPYSPRSQSDGYPIVAWAHGTSGASPDCAPSHHKNLWQHFLAPYQLALQGYVVVATDYAGLGVHKQPSGKAILHEYLASPSHANDVIYSVQAVQSAFPELSKDFVVIGHSQGVAAAWAVAQRQATKHIAGCLGSVAVSPVTTILDELEPFRSVLGVAVCSGMTSTFPNTNLEHVLTLVGERRLAVAHQLGAGIASATALLLEPGLLQADWEQDQNVREYLSLISNGGKEIGCPLLVIHGESDPRLSPAVATTAVETTMALFPESQLEYILLPHVTHTPALLASQRTWMGWIGKRFERSEVKPYRPKEKLVPARPGTSYQGEQNWYLEPATQFYHAP